MRKFLVGVFWILMYLVIRVPCQIYRFFRYNLFPHECEKCNILMKLKQDCFATDIKSPVTENYQKDRLFDFLVCPCGHFINLDERNTQHGHT